MLCVVRKLVHVHAHALEWLRVKMIYFEFENMLDAKHCSVCVHVYKLFISCSKIMH